MVRVTNGIERDGEKSKEIEGQRMMAHSAGGRSWKELERTGNRVPQPGVVGPAGNAEGSRGAGSNGLLHTRSSMLPVNMPGPSTSPSRFRSVIKIAALSLSVIKFAGLSVIKFVALSSSS